MRRQGQQQFPAVRYSVTKLGGGQTQNGVSFPGGLDLTTPSLSLQPGAVRDSLNFECAQSGGYARIQGYERFSGQTAPSTAIYRIVQVAAFINTPTVGQVITQASSGATATIIAVVSAPIPYLAVTMLSGAFDGSGAITTPGPVSIGTQAAQTVSIGTQTDAVYIAAAADVYRALIGPVPGSGTLLGVVGMIFNNVDQVYAFRANAGNTAVNLYQASPAGWVQIPFFKTIQFSGGGGPVVLSPGTGGEIFPAGTLTVINASLTVSNAAGITVLGELDVSTAQPQPIDNDTLVQGNVSANIKRVMWQSGAWAGSAAGQFIIDTPVGGNFTAGLATTSGGATILLQGPPASISLLPGGKFEFTKGNFSGQLITKRIYGCDGVNQCFEFDGVTLAPISTGLSPDQPSHIVYHKDFLIVSQGSSISGCGAGNPFKWSTVDGGWEIATGDIVTGLLTLPGSQSTPTLGVYLRSNTSFLYGSDPTTFNYVSFNTGIGALPNSAQNLFDTFVLDDLGVVTLKTTLNWGNFLPTTLTKNILPFIEQHRANVSASAIQRSKSQYRLFFGDGYGLWLTIINGQYLGAMPVLFPNPVFCCDEGESAGGAEATYFGSSDGLGYVYKLDSGTSFDGQAINAYITTAWNPIGSSRMLKRFRAASLEMQGSGYAQVQFGYQLGYGTPLISQPLSVTLASGFAAASKWGAFTWGAFTWNGQTVQPSDVDMTGTGENVQVTIAVNSNYMPAFTLDSLIYHYTERRGIRV